MAISSGRPGPRPGDRLKGAANASSIRPAMACTSRASSRSSHRTTNSSPDTRARVSPGRSRPHRQEETVSIAQQAAVRALLLADTSVVVDDTHLQLRHARVWADLAAELGVGFSVLEVWTDVDESVRRDAARAASGGRSVGEDVIRGIARRAGARRPDVLPTRGA